MIGEPAGKRNSAAAGFPRPQKVTIGFAGSYVAAGLDGMLLAMTGHESVVAAASTGTNISSASCWSRSGES
jgi:hypothetical protein